MGGCNGDGCVEVGEGVQGWGCRAWGWCGGRLGGWRGSVGGDGWGGDVHTHIYLSCVHLSILPHKLTHPSPPPPPPNPPIPPRLQRTGEIAGLSGRMRRPTERYHNVMCSNTNKTIRNYVGVSSSTRGCASCDGDWFTVSTNVESLSFDGLDPAPPPAAPVATSSRPSSCTRGV